MLTAETMRSRSLALVALAPTLAVLPARAETAAHVPTQSTVVATTRSANRGWRWYGWEPLLIDAGAFGIGVVGLAAESAPIAMIGYGTWIASGPTVHLAHGSSARALGSLGMRLSLPVVGAAAGCELFGADDPWFGCLGGVATGFVAGMALASVADAAAVAWGSAPTTSDAARPARITPTILAAGGVRGLALAGAF